jgi:hypothetical protein
LLERERERERENEKKNRYEIISITKKTTLTSNIAI